MVQTRSKSGVISRLDYAKLHNNGIKSLKNSKEVIDLTNDTSDSDDDVYPKNTKSTEISEVKNSKEVIDLTKRYKTRLQSGLILRHNYSENKNEEKSDDVLNQSNIDSDDYFDIKNPEWTEDFERRKPKYKLSYAQKDTLHEVIHGTKFSGNEDKLYACPICTKEYELQDFHISHDIAKYFNGSWSITNLLLLCRDCNSQMGTKTPLKYIDTYKNPPGKQPVAPGAKERIEEVKKKTKAYAEKHGDFI